MLTIAWLAGTTTFLGAFALALIVAFIVRRVSRRPQPA